MKKNRLPILMLGIFAAYVLIRILRETMFFYGNDAILRILNFVKFGLAGLAAVKLLLDFVNRRLSIKKILIMGIGAAFLCLVVYFTRVEELLVFWVLIAAAHDVNHKELCRMAGIVMLAVVAVAFLSSRVGLIENTETGRWYLGEHAIREGCGFTKPYIPAHYSFFGTVAYLYSRGKKASWIELFLVAGLQVLIYLFAKTKNPFVIGLFFTVLCVFNKYSVFDGVASFLSRKGVLPWMGVAVIILCAVVPFALTLSYVPEITGLEWLNNALNGRPVFGQRALQEFGSTTLGQTIEWVSEGDGYNIVDSSFINIYVNYGIIFFALVLFAYALMGYHAGKKKDIAFLIALLAVGMHSMFDCFLLMLYCNPFLMPFSYLGDNPPVLFKDIEDPTVQV